MSKQHKLVVGASLFFVIPATITKDAVAVSPQKPPAVVKNAANKQACYQQTTDGRTINLNDICGKVPSVSPQKQTIDLSKDANGDGIPDALVDEINRIETAQDKDGAIEEFARRLPYSPQTRALQQQAEPLHQQLIQAKNDAEAKAIMEQVNSIEKGMKTDPNYVRATEGLEKLLAPQTVNQPRNAALNTATLSRLEKNIAKVAFAPLPGNSTTDVGAGILNKSRGTVPAAQDKHIAAANFGWLWRGDIMLLRNPSSFNNWIYVIWYGHTGNYDGNSLVYESNPGEGVRIKSLSNWQKKGLYIGLAYNKRRSQQQVENGFNWAKGYYKTDGSTGYNYNFATKVNDTTVFGQKRLYCSQLTWKIHNAIGVDLDSNNASYHAFIAAKWGNWVKNNIVTPGIAPDEVARDSDIAVFSAGWN